MTTDYADIKSEFIKSKLHATPFVLRGYIDDLLKLWAYSTKAPTGLAANQHFGQLRDRYPGEYLEILKEIDPALHDTELRRRSDQAIGQDRHATERRNSESQTLTSWLTAGGRP